MRTLLSDPKKLNGELAFEFGISGCVRLHDANHVGRLLSTAREFLQGEQQSVRLQLDGVKSPRQFPRMLDALHNHGFQPRRVPGAGRGDFLQFRLQATQQKPNPTQLLTQPIEQLLPESELFALDGADDLSFQSLRSEEHTSELQSRF